MGYSISHSDADITDALRRIACEQLDKAIAGLDSEANIDVAIHDARKACKKLRGLIRLVRPCFADYGSENRALRDAARRLAGLREGAAGLEAFARLQSAYPDRLTGPAAQVAREALETRARTLRYDDFEARLAGFVADLNACRKRAAAWTVSATGFPALKGGLKKTYKRARRQWTVARSTRDPHELHQWRKRVKYHWYHARLLKKATPQALETRIGALDRLADSLGDHQDCADLIGLIDAGELPPEVCGVLRTPLTSEMDRMQQRAFALAPGVLDRKPKALAKAYCKGWNHWRG